MDWLTVGEPLINSVVIIGLIIDRIMSTLKTENKKSQLAKEIMLMMQMGVSKEYIKIKYDEYKKLKGNGYIDQLYNNYK